MAGNAPHTFTAAGIDSSILNSRQLEIRHTKQYFFSNLAIDRKKEPLAPSNIQGLVFIEPNVLESLKMISML